MYIYTGIYGTSICEGERLEDDVSLRGGGGISAAIIESLEGIFD